MTERGYSLQDLGDGRYRVNGVRIHPLTGKYVTQKEKQMTEATVAIPVALLESLKAGIINRSGDGWGYTEATVVGAAIDPLLALIPEPVKVGDKIKGAAFAALPPLSVGIDFEGDVWVRTTTGDAVLIAADSYDGTSFTFAEDDYMAVDFSEGTVVHIGEAVN